MDLSKISKGGKIFAGAGIVYLIATFLPWYSIDIPPELAGLIGDTDVNAWGDIGFLWGSMWALLLLVGVVFLILPAFGVKAPNIPPVTFLTVAALATLFTLLKLLIGEDGPISASYGLYLAIIAAAGATFGGYLLFKESGGDLADFKDVKKMKGHAGIKSGGDTTPPPPPPPPGGSVPPPPPPPPPPSPAG